MLVTKSRRQARRSYEIMKPPLFFSFFFFFLFYYYFGTVFPSAPRWIMSDSVRGLGCWGVLLLFV